MVDGLKDHLRGSAREGCDWQEEDRKADRCILFPGAGALVKLFFRKIANRLKIS